ncbi:MAG: DNA mismatch repair protein MutS [Eubacteriales bacterium]|nr:DNA mismatch repair protein MutS [Eubacteriales bacterium]
MNQAYITAILCVIALIISFFIWIVYEDHKRKKTIRKKIKRIYGNVPDREYETGDIEKISRYFRRKAGDGFVIDDITWNDLDMDRVYMLVNQTMSSPGEDVLYEMMRTPLLSQEKLEERDALVEFFATHEEEREKMQLMLSSIGKTRLGSLADTVLALEKAPLVSKKIHVIMLAAMLVSLTFLAVISPLYAIMVFFILSISNVINYYASKDYKLIELYLDCFVHLLSMLSSADEMQAVKWPQVKKQMDAIQESRSAFGAFRKKAILLTSNNKGTGDILQAILDYVRMVFHVDILAYNSVLKDVQGKTDKIMQLIDNIGELDAAISIASFREMMILKCKPEFTSYDGGEIQLEAEDLYHPLISEAVANSISAKGGTLVTGSNASGKSTFLKNIAINSILAQTLNTCTCSFYRAPLLKVMTSMALRDDLSGGESYFIVEIKSLKRILDESRKEEPLLCIIDEVLRGTNTIERIAASSRILKELSRNWVLPFAATHDIELSYILDGVYENYHFEEEVTDGQVNFNYLLHKGRATTRNAIKLLDVLGYDKEVVEAARNAAAEFERTGVWKTVKGEMKSC